MKLKEFKQAFDYQEPLDETVGYRDFTGGFDLIEFEQSDARSLVALLRQRDGQMSEVRLTKSQTDEGWYGYGFIVVGKGPLRRYGHGGSADGMDADIRIFPESGYVLVSLSNLDPPAATRLSRYFEPRMPTERG